jgi:hypothetical protein
MIVRVLAPVLALSMALPVLAAERAEIPRKQVYLWVWWGNLEGQWRDFIDFAADHRCDGVVIWGLQGWKAMGGVAASHPPLRGRCRDLVAYAHKRKVKVIHGLGLNGYEVGKYIVSQNPKLAATMPPALAKTEKGKSSRKVVFCPSKPQSLQLLKECLLRAAATGIDGFNFETADVDYITCHCPQCEKRFASANETASRNKPIGWPLEHLRFAADVLLESHPKLWLTCEFAMQRFGKKPYTDCQRLLELNRKIDPRMTVVWAEAAAPPDAICRKLRAERENVGFYVRSGGISGWQAKSILKPQALLPIARRLLALDPVCVMYRSYRPLERWAVNVGVAARILRNPETTEAELKEIVRELEAQTKPGGRYGFVRHIAPGNLIAPNGPVKVTASSGEAVRLVDGVADPRDGIWHTAKTSPKQAWAVAQWPKPVTVSRVRLFHQLDGHYRSLDYTVQYDKDGKWHDVPGMPIKNNPVRGWSEHAFPPVTTTRMRLLITRSKHGSRMGMGEWEVYGPGDKK